MAAASDYETGSSQPGWSIEERYVLRGLSSRATRIRRPRLGAASMKKAMGAATATTGALGTRAPDAPRPPPWGERSWPNGASGPRARRGEAGRALGGLGFVVGCELGWLGALWGRCQTTVGAVPCGALDPVSRRAGAWCAGSGVGAASDSSGGGGSAATMTTDTSTPGTAGEGNDSSGSDVSVTSGSTMTATATSTVGTTTATSTDGTTGRTRKGGSGRGETSTDEGTGGAGMAGITADSGGTDVASVPACVASPGSGCAPDAESQVQFHAQSHVQLSGVWLSICVECEVVVLQNVNVQVQIQGSFEGVDLLASAPPIVPVEVVLCVTGPLSPGLRTRTDTFVFEASEVEDESGPEPLGLVTLVSVLAHDQFHAQSHAQIDEVWLPVCVDNEVAFPVQSSASTQLQFQGSIGDCSSD
jgi:hypothetical protein